MTISPMEAWHQLVANKDVAGVDSLLADDVVFHSPVVDTPQVGKAITRQYLAAVFDIFSKHSFRYVLEVVGEHDAVLEFLVEIDDVSVNGVDMIKWNDEGQIVAFKVMLRPLKAVRVMQMRVAAILEAAP
ncbi:MAG: nuclear transport factor 2 family protein [Thermoanaerobaculia bacterium]